MHIAYARDGWVQLEDGSWRAPSPALFRLLIPERLAVADNAEKRRLFSLWSASQCEWAASGYDPDYISPPSECENCEFCIKNEDFVSQSHKTRNCVSKTRNLVFKMMNFAGAIQRGGRRAPDTSSCFCPQ